MYNDGLISLKFKNKTCFKSEYVGFDAIKPINVIIGKNNSGKSQLLNSIEAYLNDKLGDTKYKESFCIKKEIIEKRQESVNQIYDEMSKYSQYLSINRPNFDKMLGTYTFDGEKISRIVDSKSIPLAEYVNGRYNYIATNVLEVRKYWTTNKIFRRINAERDIIPEHDTPSEINVQNITSNGAGITTILSQVYNLKKYKDNDSIIRADILNAFNKILGKDTSFIRIDVKRITDDNTSPQSKWQIYLEEEQKGLVELDNSGSGLKTILFVIINLLLIPKILNKPLSSFVFAFEELENNLHPALFRRLLSFISQKIIEEKSTLFLTTHSNIALDFFSTEKEAQIVTITHDGNSAMTKTVMSFSDKANIINDLGAKASDLLQANGIIWVEGPSDRIYINKWISMLDKNLVEGRDYQCAFYGGSLLSHFDVGSKRNEFNPKKVDLLSINHNLYIICDSDKSSRYSRYKKRVKDIREIVEKLQDTGIDAGLWITKCREIENYLTANLLNRSFKGKVDSDPKQYENLFNSNDKRDRNYLQKVLGKNSIDKLELARKVTDHMKITDFEKRFDWNMKMKELVNKIRQWNE